MQSADTALLIEIRDLAAENAAHGSALAQEQAAARMRAENLAYQCQQLDRTIREQHRRIEEVAGRLAALERSPPVARCEHDGAVAAISADLGRLRGLPWWRRAFGFWVALLALAGGLR